MKVAGMKDDKALLHLCMAQTAIGINVVAAKYLVATIPILLLLLIRFSCSSILLIALCKLYGKKIHLNAHGEKLTKQDLFMISLQALCGGFLFNILMLNGLRFTDASVAGIISSTTPAMIALLSIWLLNQVLSKRRMITVICAVCGIICMHLSEFGDQHVISNLWGNILVLFAVLPEAMFTIIAKKHYTPIAPLVTATICNIVNMCVIMPIALSIIPTIITTHITMLDWLLMLLMVLSSMVFFIYWYKGLSSVSASYAALITAVAPISITLLAMIFLGERLSIMSSIGMAFVLLSIIYGAKVPMKPFKQSTEPAP